ncbi:YgjV family protein [Echinimonas agarilytica]|uniref:YgjV family protein n=1 Tax=Echinimonas agarilytica TaxID=1215918 RepID=A0AA41W8L6_9GAMM|nr:YgjV family protein [Echinimonas agarilytica]MCM2680728.1 YgjV family protein [Echinimonas agarilytica]
MNFELSLAQSVGLISFALGIATFFQRRTRRLKVMMLVFNLNHLIHFLLMGAPVSAFGALISVFRTYASIYLSSIYVALAFMMTNLVVGTWLATSWFDAFAIAGSMIGTYALFMLTGTAMRYAFLLGSTCWFINNLIIGSIGGILLEATVICVNLVTIYRLNRCQQQQLAMEH